jgi:hypothetical protein
VDPETGEAINRLSVSVDQVGAKLDRMDTDLRGEIQTLAGDLRGEIRTLAGDLREEIRSSAAETRAYVDERIQVSTGGLRQEMGEIESRTRRHFDVVAESLRGDIRAIAEGMVASREQTEQQLGEQAGRTDRLEGRVLRLQVQVSGLKADRKSRRPRRRR